MIKLLNLTNQSSGLQRPNGESSFLSLGFEPVTFSSQAVSKHTEAQTKLRALAAFTQHNTLFDELHTTMDANILYLAEQEQEDVWWTASLDQYHLNRERAGRKAGRYYGAFLRHQDEIRVGLFAVFTM